MATGGGMGKTNLLTLFCLVTLVLPAETWPQSTAAATQGVSQAVLSAAEEGDAGAQIAVALSYDRRSYPNTSPWTAAQLAEAVKNYGQAKEWYQKAAQQGHADAQYALGRRLVFPPLVWVQTDTNPDGALAPYEIAAPGLGATWIRKAAEGGHIAAQDLLGDLFFSGEGVPQNDLEAAAWHRRAADQGYAEAQESMGEAYENGWGVGQDHVAAFAWYRKAAENGRLAAQERVGLWYLLGVGAIKNAALAYKWSRLAAEEGRPQAQAAVAACLESGDGAPQDYVEAHKWWNLAASRAQLVSIEERERFRTGAVAGRDRVAKHLGPNQITEAQQRASSWETAFASRSRR